MPKVTRTAWCQSQDRTLAHVLLLVPQQHPEAASRTSILPAVVKPPSLLAVGSTPSRPAVAAASTPRPKGAMETRCSRVRPQGPGCENPGDRPRAPRTAASPSPPQTESALRAPPFFCPPTKYRGSLRGPGPIPCSHKAARERQDGKSSVPGTTRTNHSNMKGWAKSSC